MQDYCSNFKILPAFLKTNIFALVKICIGRTKEIIMHLKYIFHIYIYIYIYAYVRVCVCHGKYYY